jgi:TP901 family phage tail tape measure protein
MTQLQRAGLRGNETLQEELKLSQVAVAAAMGRVAPAARAAGIDFQDTLAAVTALSKGGADSRLVIGQLSEAFRGLENPSRTDAAILRTLSVDLQKVKTSAVGLMEALKELGENGATNLHALGVQGGRAIDELVKRRGDIESLGQAFEQSQMCSAISTPPSAGSSTSPGCGIEKASAPWMPSSRA